MANVLILCQDVVGEAMAGPAIRSWEFAQALSRHHDVTLSVPVPSDRTAEGFTVLSRTTHPSHPLVGKADVVISQAVTPRMNFSARRHGTRILLDAYDPILLELLEVFAHHEPGTQRLHNRRLWAETRLALTCADAVICASEKQRDLWLGGLMTQDRVRPETYRKDPSLRSLVDVVPFGLQDHDPVRTGPGFREAFGLRPTDTVLLWGGGIWNWFDPLTLLRAVHRLQAERDDIKLVFMGTKHPNETVPEMKMAAQAVALSDELGLTDRSVFFNAGWVPYDERHNHLLDADLGVSTHFDHVETRFSFRTRILDYLWAGLPIVSTRGDSMSELVEEHGLGRTVGPEDVEALVLAICELADDPTARAAAKEHIAAVKEQFRWEHVTQTLLRLVGGVLEQPRRRSTGGEAWLSTELYRLAVKGPLHEAGIGGLARAFNTKARRRLSR